MAQTLLQKQLNKIRGTHLTASLRRRKFNVKRTAADLGVQRSYLYHLIGQTPGLRRTLKDARRTARRAKKGRKRPHG